MSFLFEAPAFYMQTAPAQPRFRGNACGSALVPQFWDTFEVELDDGYEERVHSARRQQALKRKEQRAFAELVQQLAIEEVENQRREQRRRVIEAKKAALAEARRQEAAERRRAEAARKRHLAKMHAAQVRQALWEAARAEEAQRISHAQELALRHQAQRCAEQKRLAQAQAQQDRVRFVRIGDLLLRIVENDDKEEFADVQNTDGENEAAEETETSELDPLTSSSDAQDKVDEEVAVALAKLSAHDRADESLEVEQQTESPDATDDEHDDAVAEACQALADAVAAPTPAPETENMQAATEEAAPLEASAPVADASSPNADPVLLFSYDFPSNDTEYGRAIRKLVNADSITVEATRANGGSIKIGGLWQMQAPECTRSPPRSPRSARVSDVDENGEEVIVPVVDVQSTNELDTSKIPLNETSTIPLPEHLDGLRAELTDDGFRLWLDSA
ncbi:hypothetical protein MBRA1_001064 [Malassezia brasiliensis]|uniref:Uncharacterized protein n=1 Tax=Malassezia brasiliensis TaxID=1821822 RepID=A0AAF0DV23_9BASI|nr:hypothetical protein MBRA1_001064 [Malassezia brasiliensis]